jgi:hypothetical protein
LENPVKTDCYRSAVLLAFCCALFFLPSSALAWGCKGHQTVAVIAEKQLSPEARQLVEKLLTENPVDPGLKRYCGNATRDLLVDASTWPDDVRGERKNGPWHYIDIPRGAPRGPLEPFCGSEGCVTKAITDQLAILKDKNANPQKRADAVRYLIHFVADLHMPLHASTNNDEGGNCDPVRFFRRRPQENHNSFAPNLHSIWDTAILERDMESADSAEYANFLLQLFSSDFGKWQSAGIHVDDWAWQSHDLAESVVYGGLTPKIPIESPATVHSCTDANHIGERMFELHLYVGQSYQESAAPVVQEQLALAGVRLAMILNDAAKPGN